jgi:Holliday junction DNA helicase RuvA
VFNHVRGKLVEKTPSQAVVETNGVGYRLRISLATFERLPEIGDEVRLLARLLVREDAQELVGFADSQERDVFGVLISVNGVGLNLAMSVLSAMRPDELAAAVRADDLAALKRVKGLGAKKAERIILELRDKVEAFVTAGGAPAPAVVSGPAELATDALVALGYKRSEAETAARRAAADLGPDAQVTELIRVALTLAK